MGATMERKRIDWAQWERRAAGMSDAELERELAGLLEGLEAADARDRELGTDDGGYYRDVASVIRGERKLRTMNPDRQWIADGARLIGALLAYSEEMRKIGRGFGAYGFEHSPESIQAALERIAQADNGSILEGMR
jgi:hypothetical protein